MRWLLALWLVGCAANPAPPSPAPSTSASTSAPSTPAAAVTRSGTPLAASAMWSYEVEERYPHDPNAFTQGLWMDPGGQLWETTGLKKQSTLRKVDLQTGRFKVLHKLPDNEFGEGLAFTHNNFFWITWETHVCHTFDAHLKPLKDFSYEGEGWGLCTDPGGDLWMSNGSDKLVLRDPTTFEVKRTLEVRRDGEPVRYLNELEWVEGKIYANLYTTPFVAVIDPQDGHVEATIDFSGLLSGSDAQGADVLNGIAYQPKSKKLWVTGKKWPKLFQVKIREGP